MTGKDQRSRFDIEAESKIGEHGGPLHRRCEGVDCKRIQGREFEVIRSCKGCNRVNSVYILVTFKLTRASRFFTVVLNARAAAGKNTNPIA